MALAPVSHRTVEVGGVEVFYREAGPPDAPVLLLPHGYPSSSFQYRNLLPALGDRWRLVAPDFPGFGYTSLPPRDAFDYSFPGYARLLAQFTEALGIDRYALYLFDYGSWTGFQLAIRHPERVAALVVQNGDAYEDALGPGYADLQAYWANPTPEGRAALAEGLTEEGLQREVQGLVPWPVRDRISPDLWRLSRPRVEDPFVRELMLDLFGHLAEMVDRMPDHQAYLREHRPPTLVLWGPNDGYMPERSAKAYLADLPDAELHVFPDGGHWLLETHLDDVVTRLRDFLGRVHAPA